MVEFLFNCRSSLKYLTKPKIYGGHIKLLNNLFQMIKRFLIVKDLDPDRQNKISKFASGKILDVGLCSCSEQ